jgi:hypothetical protein
MKLFRLGLIAALYCASVFAASDIVVATAPPPVRHEAVPRPKDGFAWAAGHWEWTGRFYNWVSGTWMTARPGYHWIEDQWQQDGSQWRYLRGHWER